MDRKSAYPEELQRIIQWLSRLPGTGRRTAERMGLALMQWHPQDVATFGRELEALREKVGHCTICGNFCQTGQFCPICQDNTRSADIICVVEQASQIPVIEKTGCFHGRYHVLGGSLSPLDGIGPDDLNIRSLKERCLAPELKELLLANSADVSGEATAQYIAMECARKGLQISRLASGIPVGTNLSFADAATLSIAIASRRPLSPQ